MERVQQRHLSNKLSSQTRESRNGPFNEVQSASFSLVGGNKTPYKLTNVLVDQRSNNLNHLENQSIPSTLNNFHT